MFRELFQTAPDAMIVVDREGRIVRVNPQAERLFGFGENELHGQPIELLLPEAVRHAHRAHVRGYTDAPRVRPMGTGQELIGQKKDGQQFPVEIALSPLQTPEERLFLASVRDVSETHRARQAIARARYDAVIARIGQLALAAPNLDAAIASTPELVAQALGVDGVAILFRHAQLKRLQVRGAIGVREDSLEALPWEELLEQHGSEPFADAGIAASLGFACAEIVPLSDRDEPAGVLLALCRERTTFDHDAVHFLQSVANLMAAALQRIRMEEQLSHGQRLEAIGQLTGGVAHDFNNLLTVISGNLQILEDELADRPAARDIIGSALRAVGRGAELTRKLLAFARRQRLAPRACEPAKLLEDLGAMLRRTLGESVQLEIACTTGIAPVFADPGQLEAALVNLALNSRDAMPRGGRLTITANEQYVPPGEGRDALAAGDYVVFTVRDTGLGMPPEILARAFEPFFTTKEHGKGSGLGLSMVYGFVTQSGGQLSVESQLGYGTTITLHLPVAQRASGEGEPIAQTSSRGTETVLVVEDEDDVREIAVAFLRSLGYHVVATPNALAALDLLRENGDIALLFSDVVLGTGMNGFELADAARGLRPGLPVLLTSGYEHAHGTDRTDASRYTVLQKPYRREELGTSVRRLLDRVNT